MRQKRLRPVSQRQQERNQKLRELEQFLLANRAKGKCEIQSEGCWVSQWLSAHHIIKRSKGGKDIKENLLIGCPVCHLRADHPESSMKINGKEYPPLSIEQQLELVKNLNKNERRNKHAKH